tara:strand:- start:835 stop:1236 length:402 start_codon:yes stop_codon:yes gene_type:complete
MTDANIVVDVESDEIKKQIDDLKNKLKTVKKAEKEAKKDIIIKEKIVKPKKEKKPPVDRTTYMREYMRQYKENNKTQEQNRRNTGYYMKKYDIPKEFKDEFGVNTCRCWKAIEAMKHIKKEFPDIYPKLFQYI